MTRLEQLDKLTGALKAIEVVTLAIFYNCDSDSLEAARQQLLRVTRSLKSYDYIVSPKEDEKKGCGCCK